MKHPYVKRTQKDYILSFKLQLVQEIEQGGISLTAAKLKYGIQGDSTVRRWLQKYGNFDWNNRIQSNMIKTPEQKIMELEAHVKLFEKQKAQLERQAYVANKKVILFDTMIDFAEQEFKIDIRENRSSEQSTILDNKNKQQ